MSKWPGTSVEVGKETVSEVNVCGIPLPLVYDELAIKAGGVRGQYLGDDQAILLDTRNLTGVTALRTILHESLHGVFAVSTLTAGPEKDRDLPPELEEKVCQLLERELPDLFSANPWLKAVLK